MPFLLWSLALERHRRQTGMVFVGFETDRIDVEEPEGSKNAACRVMGMRNDKTAGVQSNDGPASERVATLGAKWRAQRRAAVAAMLSGLPTLTLGQAARSYSWMSPLRMSRRTTASPLGVTRLRIGWASCRPRCGLALL